MHPPRGARVSAGPSSSTRPVNRVTRPGDRVAAARGATNHGRVRQWLLTAPWWVLSLIGGATLSLTSTAAGRLVGDESWSEAVVSGVISGIFFGAVMGPVIARRNRRFRDAAGDIPRDQLLRVAKLAQRGAAPEDAQLRRAAHRVALDQRDLLLGQRRWAVPFAGLLLALAVWLALSGGEQAPFRWLAAVLFLVLLAVPTLRARHLAHRAELLADPPA